MMESDLSNYGNVQSSISLKFLNIYHTKTKGGILLPENKQEQLNFGTVVAVGPGKFMENGQVRPCQVKEGDTVLLPEYGGSKVLMGDEKEYYIYRDDDLVGLLSEPTKWGTPILLTQSN